MTRSMGPIAGLGGVASRSMRFHALPFLSHKFPPDPPQCLPVFTPYKQPVFLYNSVFHCFTLDELLPLRGSILSFP